MHEPTKSRLAIRVGPAMRKSRLRNSMDDSVSRSVPARPTARGRRRPSPLKYRGKPRPLPDRLPVRGLSRGRRRGGGSDHHRRQLPRDGPGTGLARLQRPIGEERPMSTSKQATPDHPIHELLPRRWSPYAFADRPVSEDDLRSLFEAARWAASSYNEQPWSYLVATKSGPEEFER